MTIELCNEEVLNWVPIRIEIIDKINETERYYYLDDLKDIESGKIDLPDSEKLILFRSLLSATIEKAEHDLREYKGGDMIKITLVEIVEIIQGLLGIGNVKFGVDCKRRALIKHTANTWLTAFQAEYRIVEQTRLQLIEEYQIMDDQGKPKTKVSADGKVAFELTDEDAWDRTFQNYLMQEIEINVNKIEVKIPMDTEIDGQELRVLALMANNEDIFIETPTEA